MMTMGITFNADEILEMAVQIEKNGEAFYRKAAGLVLEDASQVFLDLAEMELGHIKIFSDMKDALGEKDKELTVFDPDDISALYLKAMADGNVFDLKKGPTDLLTGTETVQDILRIGLEAEKNSIIFYVGLKDIVSAALGKDKVEAIIKEEMSHVSLLNKILVQTM
jgi:rubrerythrin